MGECLFRCPLPLPFPLLHPFQPSPKYLSVPAILRLLFIPLFWACNYNTGDNLRNFVLIKNEWAFVVLITLMALSHGYWSSLAMMYAPQ
jgi:equilibrative nucleoside transporter 1/2/3